MYTTTSAKQLDSELRELERRVGGPALTVPTDYAEFAAGLVIRSGGESRQMVLYDYQRAISLLLERYNTVMIVKSRQTGASQLAATTLLHRAALNRAFNSVFFSLSNVDLSSISKRMGDALAQNRFGIRPETDNVTSIRLVNGGIVNFRSYNSKSGSRGVDSSFLTLDEAGFAGNLDTLLGAASAGTALSEQPRFVFISTPSAPGCTYYDMLVQAIAPLNLEEVCEAVVSGNLFSFNIPGFLHLPSRDGKSCVVCCHWTAHPVYARRENFIEDRQKIERVSKKILDREYGLKWDSGVGSYFTAAQIAKTCILPPIGRAPRKDPRFEVVIGIDPAGGAQVSKKKSPDYCIAMVMIRDKVSRQVTQVGLYRDNRCTSAQHIKNLERLITVWNPDRVCVETVGLGGVFFSALKLTFPSLDLVPFATTARKKVTGYGRVAFLIDNGLLALWNSPPIKRELTELLDDGRGKIEAPQLGHDDIPVGIMLAVHALQHVDDENAD